jgi:hypothetical protein
MRSSKLWMTTALSAAVGCGLLVASPVAGLASAVPSRAAAKPAAHPAGFFVTGVGEVVAGTAQSALVHDSSGGNYVVTTKRRLSVSGDRGHGIYATRQPGATAWTRTEVPGLRPLAGLRLQELMNGTGSEVDVVIYECDGVYETQAPLKDTQLPPPTLVQAADTCAHPRSAPAASAPPIAKTVAFSTDGLGGLGVLLDAPVAPPNNRPEILFGSWPGPFNSYAEGIPPTDGFVPLLVTLAATTRKVVVIGKGMSGANQAIFETEFHGVFDDGGTWTTPVKIASLGSPTRDYTVESVAALHGKIWVGLLKPHTATSAPNAPTLFVAHTCGNGLWFSPTQMRNTTGQDTALRLVFNNNTGTLHAAFTRNNPAAPVAKSGIMVEARINGTWQTPKFLTHWAHDYTQQLTLTANGHAVIGYNQR